MFKKTKILGTGMAHPQKVLTNFDLEKMVDTNDQWIIERTGIRERRISSTEGGEFPSDLGVKAGLQALEKAGLVPNDIDMILVSSVTPDYKLPNTASLIQQKMGITNNCTCLDIAAACSGFVYGVNIADAMIKTGMFNKILVIGAEMLSAATDWTDRTMCILFGDAAGAVILGSSSDANDTSEILSGRLGTDSSGGKFFYQHVGGVAQPTEHHHLEENSQHMQMKGKEMFKVATRTLAQSAKKVVKDAGLTLDDVDWLIPHQANLRIIETTGKLLGIDPKKVIVNIQKYGNTSAATIPVAFHEAVEDGRIKRGDIVLFDAFGSGLTYGATLLRY